MIVRVSNQTEHKSSPPCAISALAEARFRASSHTTLRGISCKFNHGVLVLEGRLPSFYHTQLAQEIAANVAGVEQVVNQIEVIGLDDLHYHAAHRLIARGRPSSGASGLRKPDRELCSISSVA